MTTDQKTCEKAPVEDGRFLDGGALQDESIQHEEEKYSSSEDGYDDSNTENDDNAHFRDDSPRNQERESAVDRDDSSYSTARSARDEESSYSVAVDDDSSFSENRSKYSDNEGTGMRNTTHEGRQSIRGRQVSDCELSVDSYDDAASRSHSSRWEETSTNKDSKGGPQTTSSQFDEWGSFGLNGGESSFVSDNFSIMDDGNGDAPFFSKPPKTKANDNTSPHIFPSSAIFEENIFQQVDKNDSSLNGKDNFETTNNGFEDAFGGDPFAEKAGAPQNTAENYSFESACNKKDSRVGGMDSTAFEIDPFASGGFPHKDFFAVEEEDRNNDDNNNNDNSDGFEGAFFVEEITKTDAFFNQGDGKSRRISSQAGDGEEEPLFSTKISVNRNDNKNEGFTNDRERGTPLNSSSQDENGNAQLLGNCTIDVNQTKGVVQEVYTANDGETASELDTNNGGISPSESSSRNTEESGIKEPRLHHEHTNKFVSNVNDGIPSQLPLDASKDSGPSDFEINYSRPLDDRDEEEYDLSNEEKEESFHSSYSGAENDRSFQGDDDEESSSSHHKKNNSGPKPNDDNFSDSASYSRDDSRSTYSDGEATKPHDKANQAWNDSFDGSERSRSRSLNDETDKPSSSCEDPKSKPVIDGGNDSFDASFFSDEHSNSKSLANATDEASNAAFENDEYPESEPLTDESNESSNLFSDNSKRSKSTSIIDGPIKSDDASFDSHDHSGSRAIRDGTDESGNSAFDGSQHSSSKPLEEEANESFNSSFYSSESSRSLREPLNTSFKNSDHYQDKAEDSWDSKFDNNEHLEAKLTREDVEASYNDSFYSSDHSGQSESESLKEETNGSCSASGFDASGFDSSEFSMSLKIKESLNASFESSDHSIKGSSKHVAEESRISALETSEVSRSESFKEEANESYDSSCDSHENSRSRSLKRAADESRNSTFDDSRSEPMQDRSNGSRNSSDNIRAKSFEDNESRVENNFANNDEETSSPDLSHHNSVESGISFGQSEGPFQHQDSKLSSTDTEKSDRSSENSTSNGHKDDSNSGEQHFSVIPKTDASNQNSTFGYRNDTTLQSSSMTQSSVSRDDNQHEDSITSDVKWQQKFAKDRNSISNEVDENSEVSMMIGEVFGQPNELFEDFNKRDRSSQNSSGLSDNISQRKEEKDLIIPETKEDLDPNGTHSEVLQNEFQNRGNKGYGDTKTNKDVKVLSEKERRKKKKRRKQRRRRNKEAKSAALLDFAANVNQTILLHIVFFIRLMHYWGSFYNYLMNLNL
jgi:hypothetical protein